MPEKNQNILYREPLFVWAGSIIATGLLWSLGRVVPWVDANLGTLVALIFLFLPAWVLWRQRIDLAEFGLRVEPFGKSILLVAFVSLVVLPPFAAGHYGWHSWLSNEPVEWNSNRLQRFPQVLWERPDSLTSENTLKVWVEQDSMWVLSTLSEPHEIAVHIHQKENSEPIDVVTIGLNASNALRQQAVGNQKFADEGSDGRLSLLWHNPQTPNVLCNKGCGFSFPIDTVESISIKATPSIVFQQGRSAEISAGPIDIEQTFWWLPILFFVQLIAVAIPEEWFFRCYLQQRFDAAMTPKWSIFGSSLGWGWILSNALFALGHLVLDPRVERLAVFFPGLLFGWMFARTRSIAAPALMHALANVNIHVLNILMFR
jgi:membrane protease YdiL (CAAX protease family)